MYGMYEEIIGFTADEMKELNENHIVEQMYSDWKLGIIEDEEYKNFMLKCLAHYIKTLIVAHHRTTSRKTTYQDLMQSGFLAVIEHYKEFDPSKGTLTTFFKNFINSNMKKEVNTDDQSKYYIAVISALNKVAQAYGFTDCSEVQPQTLYRLVGAKYSLNTICNALDYKNSLTECSFEALTENQDMESPYENPETIMLKNELTGTIAQILTNVSSFEKYLLTKFYLGDENGAISNKASVMEDISATDLAVAFSDDEISKKAKVDDKYIDRRLNRLFARLKNNPIIRTYGNMREKVLCNVTEEQATTDDIANAFAIGDLF